uniref:WD_REPEATS_REGION domain-containing protein n=1 Tax=Echinostoma caproni TaxID=27848 RepID=A0A183AHM5_9TREM
LASFSKDGRFLATRNDNAPRALWIWSIDRRLSLFSLLVHTSGPVQCLAWDPTTPARLALCTGSDSVFMWTPQACLVVQTPPHFKFTVNSVAWSPRGDSIILLSDTQFCLCFLDEAEDDKQRFGERIHDPVWVPPRRQMSDLPFHINPTGNESAPPLPLGVFGMNPGDNELREEGTADRIGSSIGDTPNWLRQRVAPKSDRDSVRRRSLTTEQVPKSHSNRALSSISAGRQAWAPARGNPLKSSKQNSVEEPS